MKTPALDRIVETFLAIGDASAGSNTWRKHMKLLRKEVLPLIRRLEAEQKIGWYAFLVHCRDSGVPCDRDDRRVFIHLRMELLDDVDVSDLCLTGDWLFTRPMPPVDEKSLGEINVSALEDPTVANGWAIFGESSQWVLSLVERHRPDAEINRENMLQFVHFLNNQCQLRMLGVPAV